MSEHPQQKTGRTRDQTILLNRIGREWLLAFFASLRTTQFHDPQNQIFNEPIAVLLNTGDQILATEGKAEFRILDDQFFLNGLWIKPTITERNNLFSLADVFKNEGLGGVTVRSSMDEAAWRSFLRAYRDTKGPADERAKELNRALGEAGIEQMETHRLLEIREEGPRELPLPPEAYHAITAYAKALLSLRDFARCAPGEEQVTALRKGQRIICDLVDVCEKAPRLFCALSLLKNLDSYFFHHGINVLILSILLAKEIGIERRGLVDLGMAALFHDIGKLEIPDEILNKPGTLSEAERQRIHMHPINSAKTFLTLGYMSDAVAERVLVGYQHHWASRSPDAYPKPRRPMKPTLMSEIVSLCVRYDALSTQKSYRAHFTPWETVRILSREGERGMYSPEILHAFLQLMGPLPVGSWIALEDGSEGIVAAGGHLATTPPLPLVFVPGGNAAGMWIDTGKTDPKVGKRRRIKTKRPDPSHLHRSLAALFQNSENSPLV